MREKTSVCVSSITLGARNEASLTAPTCQIHTLVLLTGHHGISNITKRCCNVRPWALKTWPFKQTSAQRAKISPGSFGSQWPEEYHYTRLAKAKHRLGQKRSFERHGRPPCRVYSVHNIVNAIKLHSVTCVEIHLVLPLLIHTWMRYEHKHAHKHAATSQPPFKVTHLANLCIHKANGFQLPHLKVPAKDCGHVRTWAHTTSSRTRGTPRHLKQKVMDLATYTVSVWLSSFSYAYYVPLHSFLA